jgi:phosphoribosylamine--glycine ligase
MKILFISKELIAGDLPYRLKNEGNEVKLFIEDEKCKQCFENMVEKTDDWKKELEWVGKTGLIVFDDVGYGTIQDQLREKGYIVFGGCEQGDKLEKNRAFAQSIFLNSGIKSVETYDFSNIKSAINFVKNNNCKWVVKQNGHDSAFCYVGVLDDCSDVLSLLNSYSNYINDDLLVTLQKKCEGIEIGVGRYFNGNGWIGPIEMNVEYKKFFNGDIGPLTGEMGTLMWYEPTENRIFKETLKKLTPFLKSIAYKGDIDINCIVNEEKIYPLEATMRFGSPAIHCQEEIHLSPWTDFLLNIAKGNFFELLYKKGFFIVVTIVLPPFPYIQELSDWCLYDLDILFKEELEPDELKRIHFEGVSLRKNKTQHYVASNTGPIMYVTGSGSTIEDARTNVYNLIQKIVIPKMMYRTDIGIKFIESDSKLLKKWGWI